MTDLLDKESNPERLDPFIYLLRNEYLMEGKQGALRPSLVLARSLYTGLSTLVRLAEKRKNERTKEIYDSIERIWTDVAQQLRADGARSSEGVALLQNEEPNLRSFYLDMLWYSTVPYGNNEFKRVYAWREGTVGPLNSLLNFAGAVMRQLAVTMYPFTEPAFFQVRAYGDGSVRILPQSVAERTPLEDVKKAYWRAGYRGSAKQPRFLLSHPTLPEMDFVDMIRAHVIELCRQCFIHNVPSADAHAYIRFLVHRLKPFLDWVYTGGRTGRKNFWPDADKELRKLTHEIRTFYGRNIGKHQRATEKLDEAPLPQTVHWLKNKATVIVSTMEDDEAKQKCVRIADMIDQGIIVDRDVAKLMDKVTALIQKEGNDWHRILFSGLHHTQSVRSVVFSGDTMLDSPGHTVVVAELPLMTPQGAGQADVVFFVRRKVSGRAVWTPVMALELKTKTSVDFNIYSQESKSKRDMVPVPYLWKTALSEKEWEETIDSIRPKTTLDQLDVYERGLLREYHDSVPEDSAPPTFLQKGVILIDTQESPSRVLHAFEEMLDYLEANLQSIVSNVSGWVSYSLEADQDDLKKPPRIAVVTCPAKRPSYLASKVSPLESLPSENPFRSRVKDNRHVALYMSVPSPTSFGRPAAWISMNWHLLIHLSDSMRASHTTPRIVWLDLLGDFSTKELIKVRFGVEALHKKRKISTSQYEDKSRLLETILFVGADSEVASCITAGPDSDSDNLTDDAEIYCHHTDPYDSDTDNDGLSDYAEIVTHHTDPLDPNTDGDGLTDGYEILHNYDPLNINNPVPATLLISSVTLVGSKVSVCVNNYSPMSYVDFYVRYKTTYGSWTTYSYKGRDYTPDTGGKYSALWTYPSGYNQLEVKVMAYMSSAQWLGTDYQQCQIGGGGPPPE